MKCSQCGSTEGVELEGSRTNYALKTLDRYDRLMAEDSIAAEPVDRNQPVELCRDCAKDYHEFWDEMWRNYYSGLL